MENTNFETTVQTMDKKPKKSPILFIILAILVIGLGGLTGYEINQFMGGKSSSTQVEQGGVVSKEKVTKGSEFGVKDPGKADTAVGVVEKGGIDGEGTHKLLREGGSSQTVYMTSSVIDLDSFTGVKIQVWGETIKAQKAGWLMDVLKVKVLE